MVQFPERTLLIERAYEPDEDAIRRAVDILLRDVDEEGRAA